MSTATPQRILLVYTGGTIGMVFNNEEGTYLPFDFTHIRNTLPELDRFSAQLDVVAFEEPLDSSNIDPDVWIRIGQIIYDHYYQYDGFVVLHGSDTMAYTASALSFMLEGLNKPVIFTGAQLPMGEIRTDAKENLLTAIEIASDPQKPIREVCIYFEYKLHRGNRAKKVNTETFSAFQSPNFPRIAEAGVSLRYFFPTPPYFSDKDRLFFHNRLDTNIGLLKYWPGMPVAMAEALFNVPGIRAMIIESLGAGNLPTNERFLDVLNRAIERGVMVINITQCLGGRVVLGRYGTSKKLLEMGVISGYDLTFEGALTKLMYLLGKYDDPNTVKALFQRDLRGEMNAEPVYKKEYY